MDQTGTPIALDDFLAVDADEASGDVDLNVLDNDDVEEADGTIVDYFGEVLAVNGLASNIGTWVDGSNGGRFRLNADGTLDFDATGMNVLVPTTTTITYTIGTFDPVQKCVVVPFTPPECILTEDVWFAAVPAGPCIDATVDGIETIEWDYHKGEDKLTFELKFKDKALFGDGNNLKVTDLDYSGIVAYMNSLGATSIQIDKYNVGNNDDVELKIKAYGIDFGDISDEDLEALLNPEIEVPVTAVDPNGEALFFEPTFCIEKFDSHSPIVFDLNRDGKIGTTGVSTAQHRIDDVVGATVSFDIDADGDLDEIEWLSGDGDGFLIDNRDGNAATDMDGARLFGDQGGLFQNGYVKLQPFDTDGNGWVEGAELDGLEIWVDDGDAVVQAGELQSLASHGIRAIGVDYREVLNDRGEVLIQSTAKIDGGSTGSDSVTQLEICENALVCFDFETTAKLLTEDIWFASAPSGPCIDETVDGYDTVSWDYHKGDDKLTFKLKFKDDALFGSNNDVQITDIDLSVVTAVMTGLGATSFKMNKHKIAETDIEIELIAYGVDLGDISTADFQQLVPAEVPFAISAVDGAGDPFAITPIFCVDVFKSHSPIAFDLNGDGRIGVTGVSTAQHRIDALVGATVLFDIDADGDMDEIEWLNGDGDGLLVDNRDGNAATDMDGARLFGDQGGLFANGYLKLALLDADSNGQIDGAELDGLEVWVDDGDAVVEAGELRALADFGITSIATAFDRVLNDRGEVLQQSTAMVDAEVDGRVVYSLSGADAALFTLDAATGELSFINPPDHETPLDADGDNIYDVIVGRTIDGVTSTERVAIEVKDCDDTATVSVTVLPPEPSSIAGRYWCDENRDALEQPGEEGIQEAMVTLERWDGTAWAFAAQTLTGFNPGEEGNYAFTGLDAGTYRVVFAASVGKDFVAPDIGQTGPDDVADDSDVVQVLGDGSGATAPIALAAGQDLTDVDAGVAEPLPPGDVVAVDDRYNVALDDMVFDETAGIWTYQFGIAGAAGESILFNDFDPDGDSFALTGVGSAPQNSSGDFGPVAASNFANVIVNANGTFEFRLTSAEYDLIRLDDGATPELGYTEFDYEITDDSFDMVTDTALVTIVVDPFDGD